MDNILLFDLFSGIVFEKLYKNFPKCVHIETEKILKEFANELNEFKNFDFNEQGIIFSETLYWLKNNNFIRFKETHKRVEPLFVYDFFCVELTIKGLNLLKSPLPEIVNKKSLGDEIVENFKKGFFKEAGKIAAGAIVKIIT